MLNWLRAQIGILPYSLSVTVLFLTTTWDRFTIMSIPSFLIKSNLREYSICFGRMFSIGHAEIKLSHQVVDNHTPKFPVRNRSTATTELYASQPVASLHSPNPVFGCWGFACPWVLPVWLRFWKPPPTVVNWSILIGWSSHHYHYML